MTTSSLPRVLLHDYGGYAFTYQAARALAARSYPVAYLYSKTTQSITRNPGVDTPNLTSLGIQLSQPFQKYSFLKRRQQEIEHGQRVAQEIRRLAPDIVISANAPLDAQRVIFGAARRSQAVFVFWLQDAIGLATARILTDRYPLVGALLGSYYTALERSLVRGSDRVILIAEDFRGLMNDWRVDSSRVQVIPNWAPLDEVTPRPKANAWARQHGLHDKFCFLYSGILGLKHNPALFVTLAQTLTAAADARVVVIAEGPGADWLQEQKRRLALDNLLLLNYQPYEVFPFVLGAADVLVAVLGNDAAAYSVPSKVLTYLCARRPVLLSVPPHNLAARIVRDHCAGVVVQPGEDDAFAQASLDLYTCRSMRDEMAENGLRYAREHFDIKKITRQFEKAILPASFS